MKMTGAPILMACISLIISASVQAKVEPQPYVTDSGLAVTPYLELGYKHDDNLGLVKEGEDKKSSGILIVNPGVVLSAERGLDRYELSYFIDTGTYFDSSDDNYVDHDVNFEAFWDINSKNRFSLNYEFIDAHESRGTGISEGVGASITEPARFRTNDIGGLYSFGSLKGFGRIDFLLAFDTKDYTNYKDITEYKNYDKLTYALAFYYNISSASDLLLEFSRAEKRFNKQTNISSDNDDHFAYIGATWDLSGKTTGYAKVGYENKQFTDDAREDFSGFSWDVSLNYLPVDYSEFIIHTSSRAEDPDQLGDYVQTTLAGLSWEHYWLERFSSNLAYEYKYEDYVGNADKREDDTNSASVSLAYDFTRWLELSAGYSYVDKTSTNDFYGYKQNVYFLSLNGTM